MQCETGELLAFAPELIVNHRSKGIRSRAMHDGAPRDVR